MSVVAKLFIQSVSQQPDGSNMYNLGVVCRGEENRSWAAATPSGSMKTGEDETLAAVWANRPGPAEVEVLIAPDTSGEWQFDACAFSYGGCQVKFRQPNKPWGTLELTINASGATKVLRDAYATSLGEGKPAAFAISFRKIEQ